LASSFSSHWQAAIGEAGAAQRLVDARGAFQIVQVFAQDGGSDNLVHGVSRGKLGILRHVAGAGVAAHRNGAGVRLDLTCEDAQQGGFAGSVASDQSETLAVGDAERYVLKQEA
jgi:hypothetical protein